VRSDELEVLMDAHPDLALLAPVPSVFLAEDQGPDVCRRRGKVAFGSRNWELFRQLDALRDGMPVETYIYASQADVRGVFVSWHAHYIGHVESRNGAHPRGRRYRPPFATKDGEDRDGYWAIFWEVTDLEPIAPIPIATLRGFGAKKAYGKPFVPEGPIILDNA
jgi:hypothetical protein